jgi:hypothetical protein
MRTAELLRRDNLQAADMPAAETTRTKEALARFFGNQKLNNAGYRG